MKAVVSPWSTEEKLIPPDALRAPLSKVFEILDIVNAFKIEIAEEEKMLGMTKIFSEIYLIFVSDEKVLGLAKYSSGVTYI